MTSSSSSSRDLMNAVPPPEVWTSDFVIRSLRRRLWKAFQDDDGETALRAYQASLDDFRNWLQEEEEQSWKLKNEADANPMSKSGSKRGSFFKRRSSKDAAKIASSIRDMGLPSPVASSKPSMLNKLASPAGSKSNILDKLACKPVTDPDLTNAYSSDSAKSCDLHHLAGPILQSHINPSEPFIADDFLSPYESYSISAQKLLPDPQKREREKEMKKRRSRGPRLAAFNIFKKEADPMAETTLEESERDPMLRMDPTMTTPLHEAARLGSGDFLRILLANGGDPNVKNGNSRTSLHMCSGGVTKEEQGLLKARSKKKKVSKISDESDPPGLLAPVIPADVLALMNADLKKATHPKGKARKAAKKVGKLLNAALGSSAKDLSEKEETKPNKHRKIKGSSSRLSSISTERMDAVLALLSWVQKETGDGPSLNAVDADGRTALHYAAEMGRTEVCMAILSNFGAMLTVVDEIGARTPCELAAHRGHADLAAQLEARALLYIDPYGLDDELMATVLTSEMANEDGEWNPRSQLAAPYTWFSTAAASQVAEERAKRLADANARIKKAVALWEGARDMKSIMEKASKVGLNAAIDDEEQEPSDAKKGSISAIMSSAEKFGLDVAMGRKSAKDSDDDDNSDSKEDASNNAQAKDDAASSVDAEKRALENIRESHVERFMSYHKWNVAEALKQFRKKPPEALKKAGVVLPDPDSKMEEKSEERMCLICYDDDVEEDDWVDMSWCGHGFCTTCLQDYLKDCAVSKSAVSTITCPHHECNAGISQSTIENLLKESPNDLARIIEANTEKFVTSAEDYKFCTHPGCEGVVKRIPQPFLVSNGIDLNFLNYVGAVCVGVPSEDSKSGGGYTLTYEGVDDPDYRNCRSERQPNRAHRFCFACGEGMHWPVSCERLEEWKQKMREQIKDVEGEGDDENNVNDVAQKLWMKANTRPCPECKVPIEKNDGCNHMTCTNPNCRHEFCWICRKDWKLHGTATGGFFRCNIWQEDGEGPPEGEKMPEVNTADGDDPDAANDQGYGTAIYSSREQWKERQEMARFLHHYTRWEAHGDSATLERKMGDTACVRLAPVVEAAADFDGSPNFNFGGKGLSFVHSAFMELQECRSVLKHSYAFSFFRYPAFCQVRRYGQLSSRRREKMTFESLQSELEMMTEQMSDVVARSHLRATLVQIMFLTATTAEKREEFTNLMFSIMNDEKKEAKKAKHTKSDSGESRSSRRYRNAYSMSSPLGSLGRVVDDSWSPDTDQIGDNEIRSTIEEFMARAVPLDPPERHDVATRMWACSACTYMNSGGGRCAICGGLRQ